MKQRYLSTKTLIFSFLILLTCSFKSFSQTTKSCCSTQCFDFCKLVNIMNKLDKCIPCCTPITGNTTITSGGLYILQCNTTACIVIDSDDVILDLNGFTLSGSCDPIIEVQSGLKTIEIKNGKIKGNSKLNDGILVNQNSSKILIQDIHISDCDEGIVFSGAQGNEIECCKIQDCIFSECNRGAVLNFSRKCVFKNCEACCCMQAGFELTNSDFNCFEKCKALETKNGDLDLDAIGFSSSQGRGNLFTECVAEGTNKTASNFGTQATGFLLTGTDTLMETETKIINCIANSTEINLTGSGCAFGFRLEPFLLSDGLMDLLDGFDYENTVISISWSPCGRYLAIVGSTPPDGDEVKVLSFDGSSLSLLSNAVFSYGTFVRSVDWSPCGRYLAIGGSVPSDNDEVKVLSFDGLSLSLITNAVFDYGTSIRSVDWSPCGRYLAIGGSVPSDNDEVKVLSFDGSSLSLIPTTTFDYGSGPVSSVSWSPCGRYLAIGGNDNTLDGAEIKVLSFDGSLLSLIPTATFDYGDDIDSVSWSPCGRYLAIGGFDPSDEDEVKVLNFDGLSLSLIATATFDFGSSDFPNVISVSWSPCGRYLAVGGVYPSEQAGDNEIVVLSFDGSSLSLIPTATFDYGTNGDAQINSVDWSPCGRYLAIGGQGPSDGDEVKVFSVMNAPTNCVIDSNKACNASSNGDVGRAVGIAGLCGNLFIKNIAYQNVINITGGVPYKFFNDAAATLGILDNVWIPNC